jgi:hypothetical protein
MIKHILRAMAVAAAATLYTVLVIAIIAAAGWLFGPIALFVTMFFMFIFSMVLLFDPGFLT